MKRNTIIGTISAAFLATVALASCGPTAKTYHVKFTNGNELVEERDYKENEIIVAPEDPEPYEEEHKVYTFDGWYDGESKFAPGVTKAVKNVEYIAKFNGADAKYTVTFMNEGQEYSKKTDAKFGDEIVAPEVDPTKDADKKYEYTFAGWIYEDTEEPFTEGDKVKGNTVLIADYDKDPITYHATFKKNGEQDVVKDFDCENLLVTAPEFTPAEHKTGIWSADGEHAGEKTAGSGETITFTEDDLDEWQFTYVESATPYLITFVKDGVTVETITKKIDDESLNFTAPTFASTEHYDGEWYCEELGDGGTSLGSGAECTALTTDNLNNYTFVYQEEVHEYSVTFKKNGQADVTKVITILDGEDTAPTFTASDYHTGKWTSTDPAKELASGESFNFTGTDLHDWTFNYTEVETDYTITFKKTGEDDIKMTVNLSNLSFTTPTFTPSAHYDGAWVCESWPGGGTLELGGNTPYTLDKDAGELGDHTFIYTEEAIIYEVKFYDSDGQAVLATKEISATSSTFTAPTKDPATHYDGYFECKTEGIPAIYSGEEVTIPTESLANYEFVWKEVEHEYNVIFYDLEGEQVGEDAHVKLSSKTITAPAITDTPEEGYHYAWVCENPALVLESEGTKTLTNDELADYYFYETAVGNEYTVTYDANGGTMAGGVTTKTVTFGEEYTLDDVTNGVFDLEKWTYVNEDGDTITVPTSGTWAIASDITIKANWWISFENAGATTSAVVSNKSSNAVDLAVVDGGSLGTGKALKYTINSAGDGGIQIAKTLMDTMFSDSNVVGVNFDAKSSIRGNNWRHRSYIGTGVTNKIYEQGNANFGVETHWKTFQYLKKYYEVDYSDAQVGSTYTIWSGGNSEGREFYIDNIKPVYKNVDIFGFESGAYINKDGQKDNSDWRTGFDDAAEGKQAILIGGNESEGITDPHYTNSLEHEIVSEGNTSWKFNKTANKYFSIKFVRAIVLEGLPDTATVSVDLYTTQILNSNPGFAAVRGPNSQPLGGEGYQHPANTWVTYTFPVTQFKEGDNWPVLLDFQGSPNPTIYIDNIVIRTNS